MRKLLLLVLVIVSFQSLAQNSCVTAEPFCSDNQYNFQNNTGTSSPSGPNYGCLISQPNPIWYYMQIGTSGNIILSLSQTTGVNGSGSGIDVDFAMWGPYSSLESGCTSVMGGAAPIQCSFSSSATETLGLGSSGGTGSGSSTPPAAVVGQFYIVLLTNYSNSSGYISFNQTGGTGSADCSIVDPCIFTNLTGTVSACDQATNTYSVTGAVSFTNPPEQGQLIVESCDGTQVVVANAPFTASTYNYTIPNLTAGTGACDVSVYFSQGACSQVLNYTAPSCPVSCQITNLNANVSACQPGSLFNVTGVVEFTNPPASGQLIVQDCNGNSTTFNAPFTSSVNYNLSNLLANGQNCNATAYFSALPSCSLSVNYTNTQPCECIAEIGTFTTQQGGESTTPLVLCYGDQININANGGFVPPNEALNPPLAEGYDPGLAWVMYSCPPTVGLSSAENVNISTDPCFLGIVQTGDFEEVNDLYWINGYPAGTFNNNTVYFVPITMYNVEDLYYSYTNTSLPCYEMGSPYAIQYLPQITTNITSDCQAGTLTLSIQGGAPAVNGSNFTASNLSPATASFVNTTTGNNGTIVVQNLVNEQSYSFLVEDQNGCPVTISGIFQGSTDAAFSYPQAAYCISDVNPTPTITGSTGGSFTSTAGLSINASSGLINLAASTPGTYTVTYTTLGAPCNSTASFVIKINALPLISAGPDQQVCNGGSVTLTATGAGAGGTYVWTNNIQNGVSFVPSMTSTYTVTGTDMNGCVNTDDVVVTVNSALAINGGPDQEVCIGNSVTLAVENPLAGSTFVWTNGVQNGVPFTPTSSGSYTVTSTDINGCITTDQVVVLVHQLPIIDAGANISGCRNDQFTLTGSGGGTNATYTWTGGVVNGVPFIPPVGVTTYYVVGTDANGCSNMDSLTAKITGYPEIEFTAVQDDRCIPVTATFTNTGVYPDAVTCIWNFDDGSTYYDCGPIEHVFINPGVYGATLTLTTVDNQCTSTLYQPAMVLADPNPVAHFTNNPEVGTQVSNVFQFLNNSSGATSYQWNFGDGVGYSNQVNPTYTYSDVPESYIVELIAISPAGCRDTFTKVVQIKEDLIFYVPNAFTPDGDQFNETFQPVFTYGYDIYDFSLYIFNRWGEMVFESHDASVGWNGRYGLRGEICPDGTYTWKIEVKTTMSDERKMFVGHVNILR